MPDIEPKSPHEKAEEGSKVERARFWFKEIDEGRKRFDKWYKVADKVEKIYRGETKEGQEVFNILWANTEVLKPVIYSRPPKPEIQRRHFQKDLVGITAADVLEKSVATSLETMEEDFDREIEKVVEDFIVPGRGQARVTYKPTFGEREVDMVGDGEDIDKTMVDEKIWEEIGIEYVYWRDFLHGEGRSWSQVWWAAFGSNMSREDLKEQFGDTLGKKIPLCGEIDYKEWDKNPHLDDEEKYARVWEVWDKRARKRFFISEGYEDIIEEEDDPLKLGAFFPCPEPIFSINSNRNMIPVPEYRMYQDQAEELNILTRRINRLTDALKVRGIYDSSITSIPEMFAGEENELIPDDDYGKLAAMGGMEKAIAFPPLAIIADVLAKLRESRQSVLAHIYQITGLSDIIRGFSDPRESATAQRMKGQYGTMRIQKRQKKLQRFIRDLVRLKAEIMAEHFEPETLIVMSGVSGKPLTMKGMKEVVKLLREDKVRDFTIDIETDSTIMLDEQEDKQEVIEFLGALGQFLPQAMGAAESGILPPEGAKEILLYAARHFDAGRDLMEVLQTVGSQGDKKPDPAAEAQKMKMQMETQKLQLQAKRQEQDFMVEMEKVKVKWAELQEKVSIEEAKRQVDLIQANINQETAALQMRGRRDVQ